MSMLDWARREVEIACEREAPDRKDGEWDYGCACYESALKAYESLCGDGHSGFSWGITKQILMRLMDGKPLTPIEDTEDIWNFITERDGVKTYQCKRMSSLFKDVDPNGNVSYHDHDRISVHEENSDTYWHSGHANKIIGEMFPIHMPYIPESKPYVVEVNEFLTDRKNGDYDTVVYKEIIKPNGEKIPVKRYFADSEHGMKEITYDEFMKRYKMHKEREQREEQECR